MPHCECDFLIYCEYRVYSVTFLGFQDSTEPRDILFLCLERCIAPNCEKGE